MGYVFLSGNAAISWRSTKQTWIATSSILAEILALYEASRECIWLKSLIQHVFNSCQLRLTAGIPNIINEDNEECIKQIQEGFIKGDRTKHSALKFFFTHELQKNNEIEVKKICSNNILTDLFTKLCQNQYSRSLYMRLECVEFIIKLCKELLSSGGVVNQGASWSMLSRTSVRYTLFPLLGFISLDFPS